MDTDRGRIAKVAGGYQVPAGLRDAFVKCVASYPSNKAQTDIRERQNPHNQTKRTF